MSFSLSPGVTTREIDASAVIGAAPSTLAGFAGRFNWGPVNQPQLVSGEDSFVRNFGFPDNLNAVDFFTMSSFFAYSSGAWITRVGNSEMANAIYPTGAKVSVLNDNAFINKEANLSAVSFLARYPGKVGNAIGISICSSREQFKFIFTTEKGSPDSHKIVFKFDDGAGKGVKSKVISYTFTTDNATKYISAGDILEIDNSKYTVVKVTESAIEFDRIYVGKAVPKSVVRYWKYSDTIALEPRSATEFHLIVYDALGYFKQTGAVLEVFENLSTDINKVDDQGISAFWENAVNRGSAYIRAGNASPINTLQKNAVNTTLTGGKDSDDTIGLDEYIKAYDYYLDSETYDTPMLIAGDAITSNDVTGAVLANYLIHTIAEKRKDTLVFISPPLEAVLNNKEKEAQSVVNARKLLGSSSYATMDCNWKYMYDKYNDTFRWVPCNGDHAGLYAQNDRDRDPWVSAAGTSKGKMKNVVKFAWNPDKTARDLIYQNDINPMFVMSITGPVLFGDRTLLGKNTALSRNNVRRLMITLEKAITDAAVDLLFEFNDEFTRRRFVSMVDPFLRDAKGRRGLIDYKIIADETVNTPQVIQNNSFVGEIYIKPSYSISDIRLSFVVINASASFEEIVGIA